MRRVLGERIITANWGMETMMSDTTTPELPATPPERPAVGARPEMYIYGTIVAGVAFIALVVVIALLVFSKAKPADIALIMGTVTSPIVAIASAYFGIQVAGKVASDAGATAAAAGVTAQAATAATGTAAAAAQMAATAAQASADASRSLADTTGLAVARL